MTNLLAYNSTSELLSATEVKLYLGNRVIQLKAVDSNLNNGSHSGRVPIPLGGNNFSCFFLNIEEDKRGVTLHKIRLSD